MSTIADYFKQAELAFAAYANLFSGISGDDFKIALEDGGKGMSPAQAQRFSENWLVVDQYTDPASGFSATVFQRGTQKYLAIRGTNSLIDFFVDWGVFAGTGAVDQYQDLEAYYQRLLATGSSSPTPAATASASPAGCRTTDKPPDCKPSSLPMPCRKSPWGTARYGTATASAPRCLPLHPVTITSLAMAAMTSSMATRTMRSYGNCRAHEKLGTPRALPAGRAGETAIKERTRAATTKTGGSSHEEADFNTVVSAARGELCDAVKILT